MVDTLSGDPKVGGNFVGNSLRYIAKGGVVGQAYRYLTDTSFDPPPSQFYSPPPLPLLPSTRLNPYGVIKFGPSTLDQYVGLRK